MDEKDLKQIEGLLEQKLQDQTTEIKTYVESAVSSGISTALGQFWEGNLEPAFDETNQKLDIMQTKLDKALYHEFDRLEKRLEVVESKLGIRS